MNLLLDTHVFLWWSGEESARLSVKARRAVADPSSRLFFSAASAWEIGLKYGSGRLNLPESPHRLVPKLIVSQGLETLPVTVSHALAASALPRVHRDPFDRMLVAQAIEEDLTLVSGDPKIAKYSVDVLW